MAKLVPEGSGSQKCCDNHVILWIYAVATHKQVFHILGGLAHLSGKLPHLQSYLSCEIDVLFGSQTLPPGSGRNLVNIKSCLEVSTTLGQATLHTSQLVQGCFLHGWRPWNWGKAIPLKSLWATKCNQLPKHILVSKVIPFLDVRQGETTGTDGLVRSEFWDMQELWCCSGLWFFDSDPKNIPQVQQKHGQGQIDIDGVLSAILVWKSYLEITSQ